MSNTSPSFILYGIKNCDTIKKARRYLEENAIPYQFHDYRTDGLDKALLEEFIGHLGWEALINKRGSTWRQLQDEQKNRIVDAISAIDILLAHPSMIKRPILVSPTKQVLLGFSVTDYQKFTV